MARFEQLPADQKAVLQLLLKQGKTYDDLSTLLRITPDAVRERALNALDELGPDDTAGLEPDRADEVADYLLGQQTASERQATREFLETSAPGRAWARVVAGELRALAGDALPEIPAERAEVQQEAFDALEARQRARVEREKSSKLGGILLLVAAGIAVAVVLVLLLGGGDDDDKGTPARTTQTSTTQGQTKIERQINLRAAQSGSKALGVASIVSQGEQRAIALIGQDLAAGSRYVVWLYNSPSDAQFLGFAPPVQKNGRLQGLAPAPENISKFRELIVTRESSNKPTRPGTIILRGPLRS